VSLQTQLFTFFWSPPVKASLQRVRLVLRIYDGWRRRHPFDVEHGVDTSGFVPPDDQAPIAAHMTPYAGSQPSIVRARLLALPVRSGYTFVDLGCGKGRPLIVASEMEFAAVAGVEYSPALATVARSNASIIASRFPARPPIAVHVADATNVEAIAPLIVYYMYHPFDGELVAALVANIERQLASALQHAFFVYYNPVYGHLFDESDRFERFDAVTQTYAAQELGFGPDLSDAVVTWQTRPPRATPRPNASRKIAVRANGTRAVLVD